MRHHLGDGLRVGGLHAVADGRTDDAVQQHHRLMCLLQTVGGQPFVVAAHRVHDQAVDLCIQKRFDIGPLMTPIVHHSHVIAEHPR